MSLSCEFRAGNRYRVGRFNVHEEAVATSSHGLYKTRAIGGVSEGFPKFVDCFVEPVIEIHERVRGPELFLQFLASDNLAGVFNQHR
jgi:hypothetical protein